MKSKKTKQAASSTKSDNHSIESTESKKEVRHHNWKKIGEIIEHSDSLSIERILLNIGISEKVYYKAVNKYPDLQEIHERALMKMGVRREELALEKNLGMNSLAAYSLPQFLDRWKKDTVWRAELKKLEEEKNQNITVIMESFKKDKE